MFKWRIIDTAGRYIRVSNDEAGSVLMHTNPSLGTVFGPCTRDYMDGLCQGLEIGLGEKFVPVQFIHVQKPTDAKVDDIQTGK